MSGRHGRIKAARVCRDRGQSRDPLKRAASMTVKKQPGATRGLLNDGD